jgi:integrase
MSGSVWEYIPNRHKTAHHGKQRRIFIGPRAQQILRPWRRPNLSEYLFQPREAEAERLAERKRNRVTPPTPSQRARTRKADPKKTPGVRYGSRTYGHVITKACKLAGVPHWHPHQLRHNAATRLRAEFGIDTARAILGHSSPATTETYAEIDRTKAAEAMSRVG